MATVLALSLLATIALLIYFVSSSGIALPGSVLLQNSVVRTLLGVLAVLVLYYIADQRRRLRAQIAQATREAVQARDELHATVEWLTFSHKAASLLGEQGVESGLTQVLTEAAELHGADAAGVVGDDFESVVASDGISYEEARHVLKDIAMTAAGNLDPMLIEPPGIESGTAIAVPLTVRGEVRLVLCVWNRDKGFRQVQVDALGLMGRMIELAIEREDLLEQTQSELEGTLSVLQYLVADRRPDYSNHAIRVSDLAGALGQRLGISVHDRKALRLAGLMHDVGIISLPQNFPAANEPLSEEQHLQMQQHPRIGAEIAQAAQFDPAIQEAIACHHERMNGSGYPRHLHGSAISLAGRILAVCEVYDSMCNRSYHGSSHTVQDAIDELRANAGVLYDEDVVNALLGDFEGSEA